MTPERDDGLEREHAAFVDWDAAYVLGALPPLERRAYEDHLVGCERCRAAVGELAPLPGLLARTRPPAPDEPDEPGEPGEPDEPDAPDEGDDGGSRADLVDFVMRREHRRRARRRLLAGIAAVLLVGLAVAVPLVVERIGAHGTAPAQTVALTPRIDTPLTASVAFTPTSWGTRLSMACDYPAVSAASASPYGSSSGSTSGDYALVVTDVDGRRDQVSTWSARPGVEVRLDAATAVPLDRVASVAIESASGTVVLAADLVAG